MVNCGIITLVLYFHSKCRNIVSQHESYQRRSKVSIGKNMLHGMEIWHSRLHCSRISSCTHRSGLFNKLFFCSGEKNGIPKPCSWGNWYTTSPLWGWFTPPISRKPLRLVHCWGKEHKKTHANLDFLDLMAWCVDGHMFVAQWHC